MRACPCSDGGLARLNCTRRYAARAATMLATISTASTNHDWTGLNDICSALANFSAGVAELPGDQPSAAAHADAGDGEDQPNRESSLHRDRTEDLATLRRIARSGRSEDDKVREPSRVLHPPTARWRETNRPPP